VQVCNGQVRVAPGHAQSLVPHEFRDVDGFTMVGVPTPSSTANRPSMYPSKLKFPRPRKDSRT
jgi:hypothetical protein